MLRPSVPPWNVCNAVLRTGIDTSASGTAIPISDSNSFTSPALSWLRVLSSARREHSSADSLRLRILSFSVSISCSARKSFPCAARESADIEDGAADWCVPISALSALTSAEEVGEVAGDRAVSPPFGRSSARLPSSSRPIGNFCWFSAYATGSVALQCAVKFPLVLCAKRSVSSASGFFAPPKGVPNFSLPPPVISARRAVMEAVVSTTALWTLARTMGSVTRPRRSISSVCTRSAWASSARLRSQARISSTVEPP